MRRSSNMFSSLHVLRLKFRCTFHLCYACYVYHTTTLQKRTENNLHITALYHYLSF